MIRQIKAIPTDYAGVTFRSKNEANFARWCDSWALDWDYEPEGLRFDGVAYLPDFYLPKGKIIVEIKPPIFSDELWKLDALREALMDCRECFKKDTGESVGVICSGELRGGVKLWCGSMVRDGFQLKKQWDVMGWDESDINWGLCRECQQPVFTSNSRWHCIWCGDYDLEGMPAYFWGYNATEPIFPYGKG